MQITNAMQYLCHMHSLFMKCNKDFTLNALRELRDNRQTAEWFGMCECTTSRIINK